MTGTPYRRLLAVSAGLALADSSVVTLALPRLLVELDASVEGVAAVLGIYTLVLAAALLPAERLRRRHGPARLGAAGLALFAVACVGCAAAGSLELLLALRAVQAVGAAGALVAVFHLLGAGEEGAEGRRLWTLAAVVGFAAGPALGGVLTQLFDWRAIFIVQVPVVAAAALVCLRRARGEGAPPPPAPATGAAADLRALARPGIALALVSAALTAVLFLLVLLLVAGWDVAPLAAAASVTVLPLAALLASRTGGDPLARASTGCALIAGGTAALAFLPLPSPLWTLLPQALAGFGMGLALPALAGDLLPERSPLEAARLLTARHAGIALALILLAPVVAANLDSATQRARERGVALVLDSPLSPTDKVALAPALLGGVEEERPREGLERAIESNRDEYTGEKAANYERLGERADDTLVEAVGDAFRNAFLITAFLAVLAAVAVVPAPARRAALARAAAGAAALVVAYVVLHALLAPDPVKIADPCEPRKLPPGSGLSGIVQSGALVTLDQIACRFGSSREELVLALANDADAKRYEERHGVNPGSVGNLIEGLVGSGAP